MKPDPVTQRGETPALDADGGKEYAEPMSDSARSVVVTEAAQPPRKRPRALKAVALDPDSPPPDIIARAFWVLSRVMDHKPLSGGAQPERPDPRMVDVQRRAALDIVNLVGGDLKYLGDTELVAQRDRYNAEIARRNTERGG